MHAMRSLMSLFVLGKSHSSYHNVPKGGRDSHDNKMISTTPLHMQLADVKGVRKKTQEDFEAFKTGRPDSWAQMCRTLDMVMRRKSVFPES
jgi:hypothetical protein